jgi:hypothetical protein
MLIAIRIDNFDDASTTNEGNDVTADDATIDIYDVFESNGSNIHSTVRFPFQL